MALRLSALQQPTLVLPDARFQGPYSLCESAEPDNVRCWWSPAGPELDQTAWVANEQAALQQLMPGVQNPGVGYPQMGPEAGQQMPGTPLAVPAGLQQVMAP